VRAGVDGRGGKRRESGEEYVLKDFSKREKEVVKRMINGVVEEFLVVLA